MGQWGRATGVTEWGTSSWLWSPTGFLTSTFQVAREHLFPAPVDLPLWTCPRGPAPVDLPLRTCPRGPAPVLSGRDGKPSTKGALPPHNVLTQGRCRSVILFHC